MPNRLANEQSPYLLQHAHNPVHWYPWGEEAFAEAARRGCPVFLSIGYSTCYWCHMMESDSFERQEVADALAPFVAIKLDREERPDLDRVYMDFVVGLHGHGGWPLSVFLTPTKQPFWGGTFFWRAQFISLLGSVDRAWREKNAELLESAQTATRALQTAAIPELSTKGLDYGVIQQATQMYFHQAAERFDAECGGFGKAPKFPPHSQLSYLLDALQRNEIPSQLQAGIEEIVTTTLEQMGRGGIFDHVEGGFSRYSVDERWSVPHFEKMLYDNALLLPLYAESAVRWGRDDFAYIARATARYLTIQLRSPEGGFFAGEDAGEVGREGEYYLVGAEQIRGYAPEVQRVLATRYGVTEEGNFEGRTVVYRPPRVPMAPEADDSAALELLRTLRAEHARPHRDTKILLDWHALAVRGLLRAAKALGDTVMGKQALESLEYAWRTFVVENDSPQKIVTIYRRVTPGFSAGIEALLEDCAFLLDTLVTAVEGGDDTQRERAQRLVAYIAEQFLASGVDGRQYLIGSRHPDVLVSVAEVTDGAIPSGVGILVHALARLQRLSPDPRVEQLLQQVIPLGGAALGRNPFACSTYLMGVSATVLEPK